jgi:hypothetical protein
VKSDDSVCDDDERRDNASEVALSSHDRQLQQLQKKLAIENKVCKVCETCSSFVQ